MMDEVLRIVYGDEYDIALKRAQSDGIERGMAQGMERGRTETRKEYERILTQKDRELEATARELRELKLRYGLL